MSALDAPKDVEPRLIIMKHFGRAQTTFKPPLVANEDLHLGEQSRYVSSIASSGINSSAHAGLIGALRLFKISVAVSLY